MAIRRNQEGAIILKSRAKREIVMPFLAKIGNSDANFRHGKMAGLLSMEKGSRHLGAR